MEVDPDLSPSASNEVSEPRPPGDEYVLSPTHAFPYQVLMSVSLSDEDVRVLFSLTKPVVIVDSSSDTSSSETSSGSSSSPASPMEDPSSPPRITVLRGIDSFDAWESSLRASLEFHGVLGFLNSDSHDDSDKSKTRRRARAATERRPRQVGGLAFAQ